MWEALEINETEARQLLSGVGIRLPRTVRDIDSMEKLFYSGESIASAQAYRRDRVQTYLQKNWEWLKDSLPCNGDCSSPANTCPDARANACFFAEKGKL